MRIDELLDWASGGSRAAKALERLWALHAALRERLP